MFVNVAYGDNGLFFLAFWPFLCWYVFWILMKSARGKHKLLVFLLVMFFFLSFVLPVYWCLMTFFYHKKGFGLGALFPALAMVVLFNLIYFSAVATFISWWVGDDARLKEKFFPDNNKVKTIYLKKKYILYLFAFLIWFSCVVLLVTGGLTLIPPIADLNVPVIRYGAFFSFGILAVLFFARWLVRCPLCHFAIFDLVKVKKRKMMMGVSFSILFKHEFVCAHCGAHFYLSKKEFNKDVKQSL